MYLKSYATLTNLITSHLFVLKKRKKIRFNTVLHRTGVPVSYFGIGPHGVSWKTGWLEGSSGDRTKLPLSVNGLAGQILRA